MQTLFPGCRIVRERFLGLTKAYVAVRSSNASGANTDSDRKVRRQRLAAGQPRRCIPLLWVRGGKCDRGFLEEVWILSTRGL